MVQVSVIVPLYNKEKYIEGCLRSVLNQTFTDFELIVVDDGSTDNSLALASQISDARCKVITGPNEGPGVARNKGIRTSKGSYLTFLDADDEWEPDFLATAVDRLTKFKECDVFLGTAIWLPQGTVRRPVFTGEGEAQPGPWRLPTNATALQAHQAMDFFAMGTVMAKRSVFATYGGFFDRERCNSGEDAYLWIQVMLNHTIYREFQVLTRINARGSQLGIGRGELKPVPPSLRFPDPIRKVCPSSYKKLLYELFSLIAFYAIRRELEKINWRTAGVLYWKFPGLVHYRPAGYPTFPFAFLSIPFQKFKRRLITRRVHE